MSSSEPGGKVSFEVEVFHETEQTLDGGWESWLAVRSVSVSGTDLSALSGELAGVDPCWLSVLAEDLDPDGLIVEAIKNALQCEFVDDEEGKENGNND